VLIGVDWGTTHLRAYLVGEDGHVLARVRSGLGLMNVEKGGFEPALRNAIADLRAEAPHAPVVMSGMVGSRQGWVEAPYVAPPAGAAALAAAMIPVPAPSVGDVSLVPGVAVGMDGGAWADVMRGEETEIVGALDGLGRACATLVLPGTHSKWVTVEDGAIEGFRTYMTGDVYGALSRHTILARTMGKGGDEAAFAEGVRMAADLRHAGDLLTRLFTIRAEGLMGRLSDDAAPDVLSGLLVGAEVASGAREAGEVILVGASALAARYRTALETMGVAVLMAPEESAARGHAVLARARGLC
jgi:2-dehydro-3-deoxygalactonokinase